MNAKQKYRIALWDSQKKLLDRDKARFEYYLKKIVSPEFCNIDSIQELTSGDHQLLIATAHHFDSESFQQWLEKLCQAMQQRHAWIPALIVRDAGFDEFIDLFEKAVESNWYFDIITPDSLDSLPIRIANLLRINDHIGELKRYDNEVKTLRDKVSDLESNVKSLSKNSSP